MAPETAHTLDKEVDGRNVGSHPIRIIIQALLQNLRTDNERRFAAISSLAEQGADLCFTLLTPGHGHASVVENHAPARWLEFVPQPAEHNLRTVYSIADDDTAAALRQVSAYKSGQKLWVGSCPLKLNRTIQVRSLAYMLCTSPSRRRHGDSWIFLLLFRWIGAPGTDQFISNGPSEGGREKNDRAVQFSQPSKEKP